RRLSVSERGRLRVRCATRFISSALMSRIRVMSARIVVMSFAKLIAAIISSSQARTATTSGAYGEAFGGSSCTRVLDEPRAANGSPDSRGAYDFFRGCSARLPPRPTSRPGEVEPLEDQAELRSLNRVHRELTSLRELRVKPSSLEALGPHGEAAPVPVEDPHAIEPPGKKDIQMPAQRIVLKDAPHDRREAVEPLATVDGLRGDEDPHARRQVQHDASSTTTRSRRSSSASK